MTSGMSPERSINEGGVEGQAIRLTIDIGESDTWQHNSLDTELVHRYRQLRP